MNYEEYSFVDELPQLRVSQKLQNEIKTNLKKLNKISPRLTINTLRSTGANSRYQSETPSLTPLNLKEIKESKKVRFIGVVNKDILITKREPIRSSSSTAYYNKQISKDYARKRHSNLTKPLNLSQTNIESAEFNTCKISDRKLTK